MTGRILPVSLEIGGGATRRDRVIIQGSKTGPGAHAVYKKKRQGCIRWRSSPKRSSHTIDFHILFLLQP
jgi:hypothetical protein